MLIGDGGAVLGEGKGNGEKEEERGGQTTLHTSPGLCQH